MTTEKNEVFIGLQHESSYIVELTFVEGNKDLVVGNLLGLVFMILFC